MFFARRPSPTEIADFLRASAALPLSYEPIGLAQGAARGFDVDEHWRHLPDLRLLHPDAE